MCTFLCESNPCWAEWVLGSECSLESWTHKTGVKLGFIMWWRPAFLMSQQGSLLFQLDDILKISLAFWHCYASHYLFLVCAPIAIALRSPRLTQLKWRHSRVHQLINNHSITYNFTLCSDSSEWLVRVDCHICCLDESSSIARLLWPPLLWVVNWFNSLHLSSGI